MIYYFEPNEVVMSKMLDKLYCHRRKIYNLMLLKSNGLNLTIEYSKAETLNPIWGWYIAGNAVNNQTIEADNWVQSLFSWTQNLQAFQSACPIDYKIINLKSEEKLIWITLFEQAFELMFKINPELLRECQLLLKAVIPIEKSSENNIKFSFSAKSRLGTIFLTKPHDVLDALDIIIHEFFHNRLNLLLETEDIIENIKSDKTYYSPWRKKPRPIWGVLHGAFANYGMIQFWKTYLTKIQQECLPGNTRNITNGCLNLIVSLQIGGKVLEKHVIAKNTVGEEFIRNFILAINNQFDWACKMNAQKVAEIYVARKENFEIWKKINNRSDEIWLEIF